MEEKDLENINAIDLSFAGDIDDDDSFKIKEAPSCFTSNIDEDLESTEPNYKKETGIIIDLRDEDDIKITPKKQFKSFSEQETGEVQPLRTISADIDDYGNLNFNRNFNSDFDYPVTDTNEIDLEYNGPIDDEIDSYNTSNNKINRPEQEFYSEEHINGNNLKSSKNKTILDFNEDPEYFTNELVSEDLIEEKKRVTQGEVEADYWKKLQKKHKNTNVKGAYNTHFHLAGNPKLEQELFNQDMNTGKIPGITDGSNSAHAPMEGNPEAAVAGGDVTGGVSTGGDGGASGGCSESLKEDYTKQLQDIFNIIGFEIIKNDNDTYLAIDLCDDNNSLECKDKEDLIIQLKPYIDDCFVCPLEIATGKKFNTYNDWIIWYNGGNKDRFPKCGSDIAYLDILVNHLNDCNI